MTPTHTRKLTAAFEICAEVGRVVRQLGEIPAGELYARMMPAGLTLEDFNGIIRTLRNAGLVADSGTVIRWIAEPVQAETTWAEERRQDEAVSLEEVAQ